MSKSLVEFSEVNEVWTLEISAFALSPEEHNNILDELSRETSFILKHIDADSIRAEITGDYDDIIAIMKKLQSQGWKWNE